MSEDVKLPALPRAPEPLTDELVRKIAMDVGKQVIDHIADMYPQMLEAAPKSARLSIRNTAYNAIMEAVKAANEGRAESMLDAHERLRRKLGQFRRAKTFEEVQAAIDDDKIQP
jgi:hypothetical protein